MGAAVPAASLARPVRIVSIVSTAASRVALAGCANRYCGRVRVASTGALQVMVCRGGYPAKGMPYGGNNITYR